MIRNEEKQGENGSGRAGHQRHGPTAFDLGVIDMRPVHRRLVPLQAGQGPYKTSGEFAVLDFILEEFVGELEVCFATVHPEGGGCDVSLLLDHSIDAS